MIAETLKKLRKERGLTQVQLADAINVSLPVVATIESGVRNPSRNMVIKLSQFFSVAPETFLATANPNGEVRTTIDTGLLVDIIDALDEFLNENGLTMDPEQRKLLIKNFCDRDCRNPSLIKEILSGMQAVSSDLFIKKVR